MLAGISHYPLIIGCKLQYLLQSSNLLIIFPASLSLSLFSFFFLLAKKDSNLNPSFRENDSIMGYEQKQKNFLQQFMCQQL